MKRAAIVTAALLGLVAVIVLVALAALWASGYHAERAEPSPVPTAPSVTTPSQHEVVVAVVGSTGTQFRVRGEVFGDTGPVDLPAAGHDSAHFTTGKPVDQLDLTVYVAAPIGDETANCTISYDGRIIAQAEPVPLEHTNTLSCRVRSA